VLREKGICRPAIASVLLALSTSVLAACGGADVAGFDPDKAQQLAKDVSGGNVSEGDSLFIASNLQRALDQLSGRVGDDAVVDIKIEPGSLKLRAQGAGQEAQSVAIGISGGAFQIALPGDRVIGPQLSEIDPAAVERVARQVASEAGVGLLGISYFTTLTGTKPFTWGVYLEDGRRWEASLDGSGIKRVS
jgi:hypothetical protein